MEESRIMENLRSAGVPENVEKDLFRMFSREKEISRKII